MQQMLPLIVISVMLRSRVVLDFDDSLPASISACRVCNLIVEGAYAIAMPVTPRELLDLVCFG